MIEISLDFVPNGPMTLKQQGSDNGLALPEPMMA